MLPERSLLMGRSKLGSVWIDMSIPLNASEPSMFTATVTEDEPEKLAGAEEQSVMSGVARHTTPCCARTGETLGGIVNTVNSSRGITRSLLKIFNSYEKREGTHLLVNSFAFPTPRPRTISVEIQRHRRVASYILVDSDRQRRYVLPHLPIQSQ